MKQPIVWSSSLLILCGLFSFSSIILAEDGRWTKKADMLFTRGGLATSEINGRIYAIGGWLGDNVAITWSIVEEYDPKTDTWTGEKANMPTARSSLATSALNGKIYAVGGWGIMGKSLRTVEEYDPGLVGEGAKAKWGFEGLGLESKGKLPISWGEIKSKY